MMTPPYAPVTSVLEAAQYVNKSVGLVATSSLSHATPAAFACHIQHRNMRNEIMEHLVYNNLDVAFGGGKSSRLSERLECFDSTWGSASRDLWGSASRDLRRTPTADERSSVGALCGRSHATRYRPQALCPGKSIFTRNDCQSD